MLLIAMQLRIVSPPYTCLCCRFYRFRFASVGIFISLVLLFVSHVYYVCSSLAFRFSILCFFQYRSQTSTLSHAHAVSVNINLLLFPSYPLVFPNIGLSPSCPWVLPNIPWVFSNLPCTVVIVAARSPWMPLKHTLFKHESSVVPTTYFSCFQY